MQYSIYFINTNKIPNDFTFTVKGPIYYLTIATMIFPRVRLTSYFHVLRYYVFARKLAWYFLGVYIINQHNYYFKRRRVDKSMLNNNKNNNNSDNNSSVP